jgi:HTH-type transcriptional regulator, sugar sensing transcriptional regulator
MDNLDLKEAGLNEKEAQVYLSLLELGETSIQRISEKSGIKRTTLYHIMDDLKNKALVGTTIRKSKKYFSAEDPRLIGKQMEERRKKFENLLPELLSITNLIDKKPKIKYFEGTEGIKEVFRDTLNFPKQETLAWISLDAVKYFDIDWILKTYVPQRVEKKIWQRAIAPNQSYMEKVKIDDQKHLRQTKLIFAEEFPFHVEINLYGNSNIGIMSFEEQIGIIIESKKIYTTLKSFFELHWKTL